MENLPGSPGATNTEAARREVSAPAILLMVIGALVSANVLYSLIKLLATRGEMPPLPPELYNNPQLGPYRDLMEKLIRLLSGPLGISFNVFGLAQGVLMVLGGLKMKTLTNYRLAMAGAIAALVPCFIGCCCVMGLPVGIWSVVVLNKPEVKSAFRQGGVSP
ncbi:hypothetical protein [Vitiosangium sp. GDMCC 1.1324]|uniref:hypothetical protein n=1 Tax=Vitiosangium sp. (strain GDMCC 1.1324) TaxID=2138576 RepID=UPI000D3B9C90|nr:hypothetical protein [Vitiosangium sp. GDMCC 1.1324]PTL79393.1 hypothetical protein DAT35_34950 [Vitiosangium sp. GDMCC 1.1324]